MTSEDIASLSAGTAEIVPAQELVDKLELGRPLRIKLGLDPTAPAVTLGWAVVLRKLRQFQDAGHTAVLIVGDFTAQVGDPSGKSQARPRLSREEVEGYRDRLLDQFWQILDRDRTEVRHNSEWLGRLDMEGILKLTSSYTVARMLERDDFSKRYASNQPISIMEFLYPLLQGMDSVAVQADVELGGTDQKFNLLVGRDLQRAEGQEAQVAMTMPLLVGTDGAQKMSQSLGNYVGITEAPGEMFGKLLRVPDEIIADYRLLTLDFFTDPGETQRVSAGLADGTLDPWAEKRRMAREVVDLYHGTGAGSQAEAAFDLVHRDHETPEDMPQAQLADHLTAAGLVFLPALMTGTGLAASNGEARRLLGQGGVRLDGDPLPSEPLEVDPAVLSGRVLQVGRRRFVRLV